jgi:hypothetical protein
LTNKEISACNNARWVLGKDCIAIILLACIAIWLFRGHFFGDTLWIGNPDRLNSDLKILQHYISGSSGIIPAWNDHEMMGYDSFALPYTNHNPLVYLISWLSRDNLYVGMGFVSIVMLFLSGLAAYGFLRALVPAGLAALAGAVCYELSSLTILKVSQNSMSFAVFIVIPLLMLAIRHTRRNTSAICFLVITILLACMLNLMFLQKVAYALMLAGAYCTWRSYNEKSWQPLLIFFLAFTVAAIFALPRLISVATAIGEYTRNINDKDLRNFDVLYAFQNIYPYEILRWFDNSIFGISPSQSYAIGNNINLTEGFLLYTSSIVPFLLAVGLAREPRRWLKLWGTSRNEVAFFFWVMIACISVVVLKPITYAVWVLFLRMDFTHARIIIAGLLPLSALVALTMSALSPTSNTGKSNLKTTIIGIVAGLIAAWTLDFIAGQFQGIFTNHLLIESLVRIGLSFVILLILLWATLKASANLSRGAYVAMGCLIIGQCLLASNQQVNGPQTFNFSQPFSFGDFYQARRNEFTPPSMEQLQTLHQRIEPNKYRVALVCDKNIANGFCAGHVPEFWKLRAIDGYYGIGVPSRLRALPWPNGISLRTISFTNIDSVPWDLLGVLNVRSALVASDNVFRNIALHNNRITGRPDPATFEIVPSPARVTPRAFFTGTIQPAKSPEDAVKQLFRPEGTIDPLHTSFVEGLEKARNFTNGGAIELRGGKDRLELSFAASSSERFLVLNDLYYPGWHAMSGELELPILPTNAVMRGVLVPAGTDHVQFQYMTYAMRSESWVFHIAALIAGLALFLSFWRRRD